MTTVQTSQVRAGCERQGKVGLRLRMMFKIGMLALTLQRVTMHCVMGENNVDAEPR